jgi:hypothetical protein
MSRRRVGEAMTTRQYARLVAEWITGIGLDPHIFATHSLRRTKATLIYRRTGNLRAVQLLLVTRKWKIPSDISESKSMMRLPSLSKSKSEVIGQSGHCSARLLAALRAINGREQMQHWRAQSYSFDHLVGPGL